MTHNEFKYLLQFTEYMDGDDLDYDRIIRDLESGLFYRARETMNIVPTVSENTFKTLRTISINRYKLYERGIE